MGKHGAVRLEAELGLDDLIVAIDKSSSRICSAIEDLQFAVHAQFKEHDDTLRATVVSVGHGVDELIALLKGLKNE